MAYLFNPACDFGFGRKDHAGCVGALFHVVEHAQKLSDRVWCKLGRCLQPVFLRFYILACVNAAMNGMMMRGAQLLSGRGRPHSLTTT